MPSRGFLSACSLAAIMVLLVSTPALGERSEPESNATPGEHRGMEHELHSNHFGGLIGVSTHHNTDDSGPMIGLEYARVLSKRFALAAYVELVSSRLERDVIVAVGGIYYPIPRLGLILAPGIEAVEKEVTHDGEVETETEAELLIRLGAGYGFAIASAAALGPVVTVDWAGDRWTSVFGLGMTVGF